MYTKILTILLSLLFSFGPDRHNGHLLAMAGEDGHLTLIDSNKKVANQTVTREWWGL